MMDHLGGPSGYLDAQSKKALQSSKELVLQVVKAYQLRCSNLIEKEQFGREEKCDPSEAWLPNLCGCLDKLLAVKCVVDFIGLDYARSYHEALTRLADVLGCCKKRVLSCCEEIAHKTDHEDITSSYI